MLIEESDFRSPKKLYKSPNRAYQIYPTSLELEDGLKAAAQIRKDERRGSGSTDLTPLQLDITCDTSIPTLLDHLPTTRLDVLINNCRSGSRSQNDLDASSLLSLREAFNATYGTNVTGTHVLTHTVIPCLLHSSNPTLIFMSSGTSSLTDSTRFDVPPPANLNRSPPPGWPKKPALTVPAGLAHRASKAALNMLMRD